MQTVGDLMTPEPKTIEPGAAALAALELMIEEGIRHLPVMDRARLVGILSLDDLRAALPFAVSIRRPPTLEERASALELSVGETMTHAPLTTTSKTSVADAAGLLARLRIGCLPVVDGAGRLVGILSETDVLRSIAGLEAKDARRHGDLRAQDLEHLVAELRAERNRILRSLGRAQEADRELIEEERAIPTDLGDKAAHRAQLAVDEPLAQLAARRLESIERALERAAQGRLGKCEKCGRAIPVARLRAMPGAVLCVQDASQAS